MHILGFRHIATLLDYIADKVMGLFGTFMMSVRNISNKAARVVVTILLFAPIAIVVSLGMAALAMVAVLLGALHDLLYVNVLAIRGKAETSTPINESGS